jgi:plastocyanin
MKALALLLVLVGISFVVADLTYTVTTPGFYYSFSGVPGRNPTLTIKTGTTVVFNMQAGMRHPLVVSRLAGALAESNIYENQSPASTQYNQPITVVFNETGVFYYTCTIHDFFGTINVVDRLLEYTVTTPGFYYAFEGTTGEEIPTPGDNPEVIVHRFPTTVRFNMAAAENHPMVVSQYEGVDSVDNIYAGQSPAAPVSSGPITVTFNERGVFYYTCAVHFFGGRIRITGPPVPTRR